MEKIFSRTCKSLSLVILGISLHVNVFGATSEQDLVRLSGHIPNKVVNESILVDRLESNARVPFTFVLPLRNEDKLDELIARLYDPKDPHYGKYLSTEEFVQTFAPTQED